jgi:transcription initiation factor TFIIE subunit beta
MSLVTQVVNVVEWLNSEKAAKSLDDILAHLSRTNSTLPEPQALSEALRKNPRIDWSDGAFIYRPEIPVHNKDQLLLWMQRSNEQSSSQSLSVKDLKNGWPDCEPALSELESEHRVLLVRPNKKDNHPKSVWLNDAKLHHKVDDEFRGPWTAVKLPSIEDIVVELNKVGQKAMSQDPSLKEKVNRVEKKKPKRAVRSNGNRTNKHMEGVLKDFSSRKR